MRYSIAQIEHQLRLGGDSRWEFRQIEFAGDEPIGPSRDDLAGLMAGLADRRGGVLLCSVSDGGDVVAMSREQMDRLGALFVEIATDVFKPPLIISTYRKMFEGKPVFMMEVPEDNWMPDLCFDREPVPKTDFDALDESLWRPLLNGEGGKKPEAALEKLGILAVDDGGSLRPTAAGILLCCRSPEEHLFSADIAATRYKGNDRSTGHRDALDITGPLNEQIKEAVDFVRRNNHRDTRLLWGRQQEYTQYSLKAVFEGLVNAVVHRDYSKYGSRIRLSMFRDRLEIQSPGTLPDNLILERISHEQSIRNQVLASFMSKTRVKGIPEVDREYYMECRGGGVPIIQHETQELADRDPQYRIVGNADVCLTIPAAFIA